MGVENKVKLHGFWASPFVRMVKIALSLKGISYECIEENMKKKSISLVQCNPVYMKVPVLIHGEKPTAESLVILEYIDDTWKDSLPLFPNEPLKKSVVRFWVDFIHKQVYGAMIKVIRSQRTEEHSAIMELEKNLLILEENMKFVFESDPPSIKEERNLRHIIKCFAK